MWIVNVISDHCPFRKSTQIWTARGEGSLRRPRTTATATRKPGAELNDRDRRIQLDNPLEKAVHPRKTVGI